MKFLVANIFVFLSLGAVIFFQVASLEENRIFLNENKEFISERAPAAINPGVSSEIINSGKISSADIKQEISKSLNCNGIEKEIITKEELVIISGMSCGKLRNIKITNLNNGFTASVFELSEKQYKTDLIPLTIGANKITVEYELTAKKQSPTEKKTQFIIHRQN